MFTNPNELPKVKVERELPPDMATHNPEFYLDQSNLNKFVTELGEIRSELEGLDANFRIDGCSENELNDEQEKINFREKKARRKADLEDRFVKVAREIADFHARTDSTIH